MAVISLTIEVDKKGSIKGIKEFSGELQKIKKGAKTASDGIKGFDRTLRDFTKTLAKSVIGFLGLRKLFRSVKDITLYKASVDLATNALLNLGRVSGVSEKFLMAQITIFKSMGIATENATKTLSKFLATGIDITKAAPLARLAQDAAVLAGIPTSQSIERIVRGIVTLRTRTLRTAGVFVSLQEGLRRFSKETGRSTDFITTLERQQILLNEVMQFGQKITGTYENSLSKVGKRLLQLDRLWKEAKLALGSFTQDALVLVVAEIQKLLKNIIRLQKEGKLDEWGRAASESLKGLFIIIRESLSFMVEWRSVIVGIGIAFIGWKFIRGIVLGVSGSIALLNTQVAILGGQSLVAFIKTTQILTLELGLFGAASISLGTALSILGTALGGLFIGAAAGKAIGGSTTLRNVIVGNLKDISGGLAKFVDDWVFGWSQVTEADELAEQANRENFKLRTDLAVKEAKKVTESLKEQVRAQQGFTDEVKTSVQDIKKAYKELGIFSQVHFDEEVKKSISSFETILTKQNLTQDQMIKLRGRLFDGFTEIAEEARKDGFIVNEEQAAEVEDILSRLNSSSIALVKQVADVSTDEFGTTVVKLGKSTVDTTKFMTQTANQGLELLKSLGLNVNNTLVNQFAQMIDNNIDNYEIFTESLKEMDISATSDFISQLEVREREFDSFINSVRSKSVSLQQMIASSLREPFPSFGGVSGGFQKGTPFVPFTGNFKLHQGEAVIPASQNPFTQTTNNSTTNNFDFSGGNVNDPMQMKRNIRRSMKLAGATI